MTHLILKGSVVQAVHMWSLGNAGTYPRKEKKRKEKKRKEKKRKEKKSLEKKSLRFSAIITGAS